MRQEYPFLLVGERDLEDPLFGVHEAQSFGKVRVVEPFLYGRVLLEELDAALSGVRAAVEEAADGAAALPGGFVDEAQVDVVAVEVDERRLGGRRELGGTPCRNEAPRTV